MKSTLKKQEFNFDQRKFMYLSLILVQPLFGVVLCGQEANEVQRSQTGLSS